MPARSGSGYGGSSRGSSSSSSASYSTSSSSRSASHGNSSASYSTSSAPRSTSFGNTSAPRSTSYGNSSAPRSTSYSNTSAPRSTSYSNSSAPRSTSSGYGGQAAQRSAQGPSGGVVAAQSYRGAQPHTVVYTDGACRANGTAHARAGYGVHFPGSPAHDLSGRLPPGERPTNQRAELYAVREAIRATAGAPGPVEIRTDSRYAVDGLTKWVHAWDAGSRDPASVANYDMFQAIRAEAASHAHPVVLSHVPGHSGDAGNDSADALARRGASYDL